MVQTQHLSTIPLLFIKNLSLNYLFDLIMRFISGQNNLFGLNTPIYFSLAQTPFPGNTPYFFIITLKPYLAKIPHLLIVNMWNKDCLNV